MIDPYERHILTLSAALLAERAVSAVRQPPARAFFRHFREAIARASISVGPVQVCLDAQRDRPEPRIKAGHIAVSRLTRTKNVLTCEDERSETGSAATESCLGAR